MQCGRPKQKGGGLKLSGQKEEFMKQEVGFVGYECGDIVFYLARMLSFLGKRTAVLDRTEHRSVLGICGNAGKSANILISESLDEIL